jgi:DNA-binding transcriptional ArsR family regulator
MGKKKGVDPKSTARIDQRWVKALAHPLRVEILHHLHLAEASPNELKSVVGTTLSHAAYHVKVLRECECIVETRREPVRGAVEHFYRAVPKTFLGDQEIPDLPPSLRPTIVGASYLDFSDKLTTFLGSGDRNGFEQVTLESMIVLLDEAALTEATKLMRGLMRRIRKLDSQSRERSTGAELRLVSNMLGLSLFPLYPPDAK